MSLPRIATLANGVSIFVYAADHAPPHFHVRGPDAQIKSADLSLMRGTITRQTLRDVGAWAAEHRDLLTAAWREFNERD